MKCDTCIFGLYVDCKMCICVNPYVNEINLEEFYEKQYNSKCEYYESK